MQIRLWLGKNPQMSLYRLHSRERAWFAGSVEHQLTVFMGMPLRSHHRESSAILAHSEQIIVPSLLRRRNNNSKLLRMQLIVSKPLRSPAKHTQIVRPIPYSSQHQHNTAVYQWVRFMDLKIGNQVATTARNMCADGMIASGDFRAVYFVLSGWLGLPKYTNFLCFSIFDFLFWLLVHWTPKHPQ